jgi:hypothetical protein
MTDEQFLDVLNFDNAGREDVHPLHEAGGWRQWMEKTGKGVLGIAARIGQSKEYVYQRLKYAALIESAAKAFLDGAISAGHAILIARLEPKAQEGALKFALAEDWQRRKPGVRALADHLHRDAYVDLRNARSTGRTARSWLARATAANARSARRISLVLNSIRRIRKRTYARTGCVTSRKSTITCTESGPRSRPPGRRFYLSRTCGRRGRRVCAVSRNTTSRNPGRQALARRSCRGRACGPGHHDQAEACAGIAGDGPAEPRRG